MPTDYRSATRRKRARQKLSTKQRHRRYARVVVGAVLLGVVAAAFWLRSVLLPFVIALIMVYVLAPSIDRLHRRGVPRWVGVIFAYLVFFLGLFLFSHYLVPKLEYESKRLIQSIQTFAKKTPDYVRRVESEVENLLGSVTAPDESLPPMPPLGLRWGFGPSVDAEEALRLASDIPHLPAMRFRPGEQEVATMASPLPGTMPDPRAARREAERANIIVSRIRDGEYGIRFNESSVELETLGEGRYNIDARAGRLRGSAVANLRDRIMESLRAGLEKLGSGIIGSIVSVVQSIITGVLGAMIAIIVTFMVAAFILIDLDNIKRGARNRIPPRYRADFEELVHKLDTGLSGVVRGQLIICLVNGLLSFVGFLIFIPEYAIVMAILSGTMSLIPIFGTIMSAIPAVLIGLTVSFTTSLAVLGWILGVHFIEANILNPKIVGTQAHIHPAIIMFVILAGERMYGAVGALLAVPVASIVLNLVQFAYMKAERVLARSH